MRHGVGGHHKPDPKTDGRDATFNGQIFDKVGQEGNDDAKSDHVDERDQEEDQELTPNSALFGIFHESRKTVRGIKPRPVLDRSDVG